MHWITEIDLSLLHWIESHLQNEWLTSLMRVLTHLGDAGWLWIVLGIGLTIPKRTRAVGVQTLLALLLGLLSCNLLLKPLVARPRPFAISVFKPLQIAAPTDASFPSGHTCASFEGAFVIAKLSRWVSAIVWTLALLISFSRLYLTVHYPSDVLFGLALGLLNGFLAGYLLRFIQGRFPAVRKFL